MAVITSGTLWAEGVHVTATTLSTSFSGAVFASGSVDDSSTELVGGAIVVKDLGVTSPKIASSAITTAKIAGDAVTSDKIADDAIDSEHYADGSIDAVHIASDAVITAKILDDAVTYEKVDTATQAELEGESAAGIVTPDFIKYHPGVAKAYGIVEMSNGNDDLTGAYNVTSATESGVDRVIVLAVTMADTNYTVTFGDEFDTAGTLTGNPSIKDKTTTGFTITGYEATGKKATFTVFGNLA